MFIIFLEFSESRNKAPRFLGAHKAWLQQGFADGVFLLAGGLKPDLGGGILATGVTRDEIEARIATDPYVVEDVVKAEIIEMAPTLADDRLAFLKDRAA